MTVANEHAEIAELRLRLEEAEETIRAIRSGAVDAFVIEVPHGAQVYTLQTADRPYRLLVEEMQQGALTLSDDGTIAYCNRRFADLVGKPLERMMGVAFGDFLPLDAQILYEHLLRQGRAGSSQGEIDVRNADGALVPVFLTLNSLPPDCGAAIGVLVTDLTTQRHHEKLNAAVEALKESDRRKNEFLAMLAHELRNPLAPIRNALQILRHTTAQERQHSSDDFVHSATAMMERQVDQMVRLVDDLLDVSRISRGKIELRLGRIELSSVVHQAVEAARSQYESMNHELTITLPSRPIYLDADPARLAQVVGNLLNNACKFTDNGGRIELVVSVEESGEQEDSSLLTTHHFPLATIRVRDNGIGIDADQLPRVFEMFMQVDTSLERSVSGLGIGLTLVKSLVEMHGGRVEVHSDGAGLGTEFAVRLPIVSDEWRVASGEKGDSSSLATRHSPLATSPRRILVVDDNRDSASTLAMLLKLTGNETLTAYDGVEALQAAEKFQPDIILLDIGLPKLNGYEVCRRIREQPWGENIVLVALTGWGQEEDRQKSKDAGFNAHMVKPVDLAALTKLLVSLTAEPAVSRG